MSIRNTRSIIHHVPRTAGMFLRQLCGHNGVFQYVITDRKVLNQDSPIAQITKRDTIEGHHFVPELHPEFHDMTKYTVLREPITWYWSMWGTRQYSKTAFVRWDAGKRPFDKAAADNFPEFVEKIARLYPNGFLIDLYDYYVSQSEEWGIFENLRDDVTQFLEWTEHIEVNWLDKIVNDECPEIRGKFQEMTTIEAQEIIYKIEERCYEKYYPKAANGRTE